jgi:hypothetical protein
MPAVLVVAFFSVFDGLYAVRSLGSVNDNVRAVHKLVPASAAGDTTGVNRIRKADAIASAVKEQTATTSEISRSVRKAADGSAGIADTISGVATAAASVRLSGGRLLLNVVTGGDADEQRRFGEASPRCCGPTACSNRRRCLSHKETRGFTRRRRPFIPLVSRT